MKKIALFSLLIILISCDEKENLIKWQQLFNRQNLNGWIPKISKHPYNNNYGNTFRIVDNKIQISYDKYDTFDQQYGHLFYEKPFSAYILAAEYRFIGKQANGGENWAYRNSGLMLHCQDPKTILLSQDFPISIEAQILGGNGSDPRHTLNLCTPGTNVMLKNELFTSHCTNSSSKTYHGDQWVRAVVLVLKDSIVKHIMNGKVVLEYTKPQIGGGNVSFFDPNIKEDGKLLSEGYISIQSESHPMEYRKIEIMNLEPIYNDKNKLQTTIKSILKAESQK